MTISKSVNLIITIVAVALFFISGIGVGLMIKRNSVVNKNKEAVQALSASSTINADKTQSSESDIKTIFERLLAPERKISNNIKWISARQIPSFNIFGKSKNDQYSREELAKYYRVGKFIDGKYKDGDLILVSAGHEGPFFYPGFYRFIKNGDSLVFLKKYSDELYDDDGFIRSKFTIDEEYDIPELDYPKYIKGPGERQYLEQDESVRAFMNLSNLNVVSVDAIFGNIYTTDDGISEQAGDIFTKNGFYIEAPDGIVRVYYLKVDIVNKKNVPEIIWNDGAVNSLEYVYSDMGGCGAHNYASVAPVGSLNVGKDLEIIGKTSKGDNVYGLKDKNSYFLKDFYNNAYQIFNDGSQSTKVSYEKFVADRPLFYWIDPFGRMIKFQNNKFIPPAECGKPVIYLYPEKETEVSVKVEPKGGLSKSDPEYGSGWKVLADRNGELTELKTGKKYPYLFWEGRGGIYEQPKQGFLVERNNVHRFLIEKLSLLGLNEKERVDFMEFWEPKMQSAPYYFVTFLGNREMNALAPLEISPTPDSVIRVLMDFSPLDRPIKTQEYEIKTPERDGFTAVEWGGVIR